MIETILEIFSKIKKISLTIHSAKPSQRSVTTTFNSTYN